jgi:hypothetical protein
MRKLNVILTGLLLSTVSGWADTSVSASASASTKVMDEATGKKLSVSASVYAYSVSGQDDYVQPTVMVDYGPWHLEARYNYEAQDTASLWGGYGFDGGDKLQWQITPMLGWVFGDVDGVGIGYRGSLRWWKFMLYSEGEQLFGTDESDDSYFYNWSELTLAPVEWFRFGVVTQRTRAYSSDRDIQRGLLVGATFKRVDVNAYVLNPDEDDPTWVMSVSSAF